MWPMLRRLPTGCFGLTGCRPRQPPASPCRGPSLDLPAVASEASAADMEIVLAGDNLEMLEELEFYAWLTDQQDAG